MLNSPSPVNFVHVKRIALACYEAHLKFQNVVLTDGPLYHQSPCNAFVIKSRDLLISFFKFS